MSALYKLWSNSGLKRMKTDQVLLVSVILKYLVDTGNNSSFVVSTALRTQTNDCAFFPSIF